MHQRHKIRLQSLENATRLQQRKLFVVYDGDDTTECEAYEAAHGPGAAVVLHVVYESPVAQDAQT